tara:strand:+ start:3261 stop:3560 length:300 start_codon:yes stop_codon:yes gene_type:complete
MEKFSAVYKDLEEVRKLEESRKRGYTKKKGITVLCAPERNEKTKFVYSGIVEKSGDCINKLYPDFQSLGKLEGKVRKILLKPLNKRQIGQFCYYKLSEI